ncbi:MAG: hypothetical protein ACREHC_09025 [Candidatus Levyibacteriota bacterium]
MAVETLEKPNHAARLEQTHVDERVAAFPADRRESLAASKLLKTLGFLGTVVGVGLLVAAQSYAAPGILAASVISKMWATGEVALKIGAPLMIFGALKELYNKKMKP